MYGRRFVHMHVKPKEIAFLGILLALTCILVYLGNVIEPNTLFFLCAASFCLGIAFSECGKRLGIGFFVACTLLTFILIPNKIYCITLAAINLYIVGAECLKERFPKAFLLIKFSLFNILYVPALLFMPQLIYKGKAEGVIVLGIWVAGQVAFAIYDYAYRFIVYGFWPEFRKKVNL